jgi:hypothetical protein
VNMLKDNIETDIKVMVLRIKRTKITIQIYIHNIAIFIDNVWQER